jgi:hypothetical protein
MAEGFPVIGEAETACHQPGFLQPGEVHVENGPADLQVAGELAHMRAPDQQDRHDAPPRGMVKGRDHPGQLAGWDGVA